MMSLQPKRPVWSEAIEHYRKFISAYGQILQSDDSRYHGGLNAEDFVDQIGHSSAQFLRSISRLLHAQGVLHHRLFMISKLVEQFTAKILEDGEELSYQGLIDSGDPNEGPSVTAERCYRLAIDIEPEWAPPRFNLASMLLVGGMKKEAELLFRSILDKDEILQADTNWHLATIRETVGDLKEAEKFYRTAISQKPHFGVVHRKVADFFRKIGCLEEAQRQYRIALQFHYYAEPELYVGEIFTDLDAQFASNDKDAAIDLERLLKLKGLV